jgi:hypothetical protein
MSTDTRLPASSAGMSKTQTFGTASVRLFAPQYVFELVRAEASATARGRGIDWHAPAANENGDPHRSSAA